MQSPLLELSDQGCPHGKTAGNYKLNFIIGGKARGYLLPQISKNSSPLATNNVPLLVKRESDKKGTICCNSTPGVLFCS